MDLREPAGALKAFAATARIEPDAVSSWLNMAMASRAAGSYGRALSSLAQAIRLAPEDASLHARRGHYLLELHRATEDDKFFTQALAAWQESLRLDPHQLQLRRLVARYTPTTPTP